MDKPISQDVLRRRKTRRWLLVTTVIIALGLATAGLSHLGPALPTVDKATLYIGAVQRGNMLLQVRGSGTLVPEQIQFVQAETDGRIERILVQPGATVTPETVLMELSNPALSQETFDAEWQWKAAEAQLIKLRAQIMNEKLSLESSVAGLKVEFTKAQQDARMDEDLAKKDMVSWAAVQRSRLNSNALLQRLEIEQRRLKSSEESIDAQLAVQQADVERAKALLARKRQQVTALRVLAGVEGVLQQTGDAYPLQTGQRVTPSTTLAKIVQPTQLKAVLKIAETQVKDVQIGQRAEIDTRNGIVPGQVVRVDPAAQAGTVAVDIKLEGALPRGARPDLFVDGVIELERLESVLYVNRPVQGQADGKANLFKIVEGGTVAQRVPVKLGRNSVNLVEVLEGLQPGDQVILSDMATWDGHDRVRLQ